MKLTDEEVRLIRDEAAHYEQSSAASIEALKIVQARRGWVSDENLAEIAALLAMSPAQLEGVATFYNLIYRRPVGRKVIHYCNSVSCWMLGAEENREYLQQRLGIGLGETTADGAYTLLPIVCLGACDKAPVLMMGEETHCNVDRAAIDRILADQDPDGMADYLPPKPEGGCRKGLADDQPPVLAGRNSAGLDGLKPALPPSPVPFTPPSEVEGDQGVRFATLTIPPSGGS